MVRVKGSLRQRAEEEGVSPTTIAYRENAEYRKRHLEAMRRWYRENREERIKQMSNYNKSKKL